WAYAYEPVPGQPDTLQIRQDPTLEDPRCVFQILRRHFARYTPDLVEQTCGAPKEQFLRVAEALAANSGRERTGAICYAVGWTQHSNGVQIIRTAAILQLLLGNIGRPGGGIMALRGHASIQGSTDVPTLFDLLSGYMPQPTAESPAVARDAYTAYTWQGAQAEATDPDRDKQTLAQYVAANALRTGWWSNFPKYIVSFLKAWYGDAAQPTNDFCFSYVPKTVGDHSHLATTFDMVDGKVKGFILLGQNPAAGSSHARLQRQALQKLDWLVVRDLYEIETASFWKAPGVNPAEIATEVFFLPAAGPGEKAGCFTNTQRLLQWKEKAVDPPNDARSDAWFIHNLAKRLKKLYADSTNPNDRPIQDLFWDFDPVVPDPRTKIAGEPDVERVLKELNGFTWADRRQVADFTELKDDGSTACGSWIYSGVYPAEGVNRAAARESGDWLAPGWGYAWPLNRRILYNRASADPAGRPWSERKKYVWWDEEQRRWVGYDVPDFPLTKPPDEPGQPGAVGLAAHSGSDPFLMMFDGKGWLYAPRGLKDGPLPVHYEPAESPRGNLLHPQHVSDPTADYYRHRRDNPLAPPGDPRFPIVLTTYRLTEHHVSGPMS
ncbi:MAG TPA: molybdopterin-dependent oxidoreductase, partial [Chloroflexota bacterium]